MRYEAAPLRDLDAAPLSLRAVNGLRGPAALGIAVFHFGLAADFISYRDIAPLPFLVDMFFVLSGLIIARAYSEKLSRPAAIPGYVIRRLGRIWPLQAATLALLVAYESGKLFVQTTLGHHFSSPAFSRDGDALLEAIPTNLLLIQALGMHSRETWNFPSWSLSVEFVTYITFAAFCLIRPVLRRILTILMIAVSLAILVLVAPYHMRSTFDYGIFRCFVGFFAGTLCYDAARRWQPLRLKAPTLVEAGALLIVILWMAQSSKGLLVFAAPFVFCAFVLALTSERGLLSRILLTRPMQDLAELSFAIYMVHAIVLIALLASFHALARVMGHALFTRTNSPLAGLPGVPSTVEVLHVTSPALLWACAAVYIAAVLVAAYAAYRWIEVPGRAYFGRIAKRVDVAPVTPLGIVIDKPMEPAP